ncbi:MAG: radical SAM family heme chaperone HemW [Eubacteriales bacterium]|nr:radical SAM family heme chaperone HemW [Eubacteriales bacterium]
MGIYIHIPFCERKCSYCDFLSFYAKDNIIKQYIEILKKEIVSKKFLANGKDICTIYIGGGTPSFINPEYIKQIINLIKENYNTIDSLEITIELNPHSAIKDNLYKYKEYKINRLSIGAQSTNNDELNALGRIHTYEDFLQTMDFILRLKFQNVNIDLMNGIPLQTLASWKNTLKKIILFKPTHLSIYNLILEENTELYKLNNEGSLNLPNEKCITLMDLDTFDILEDHGYERYEISNYCKKGFESKHNLGYWSDIPYIGFGLGASSYIDNIRYKNISNFSKYLNLNFDIFQNNKLNEEYYDSIEVLNQKELIKEYVMLGLRKVNGINIIQFKNKFNVDFREYFDQKLEKYLLNSMIVHDGSYYHFTKRGMDVSNTILSDLLF